MPIAYTAGGGEGGSVLTQHQSCDMETDGQRDTCHGSSGRPGALLKFFLFLQIAAVHQIFYNYYFGIGEDNQQPGLIPSDTSPLVIKEMLADTIHIRNGKHKCQPIGNKESQNQPIGSKDKKNCSECGMLNLHYAEPLLFTL